MSLAMWVRPATGYVTCPAWVKINGGYYQCEQRPHHSGNHWNNLVRTEWNCDGV